jgi:hypothetical protein
VLGLLHPYWAIIWDRMILTSCVVTPACPQQPDVAELQQLLQPVAQHMMDASAAAENRRSQAFNQVKVVAEALQGLSWLAYTGPSCGEHTQLALVHLRPRNYTVCLVLLPVFCCTGSYTAASAVLVVRLTVLHSAHL